MEPSAGQQQLQQELASRRLFVANLPALVSQAEFVSYFSRFGELESVKFGSRGFGFVTYRRREDAGRALKWPKPHLLFGRAVLVDEYRSNAGPCAQADRRLYVRNLPPGATLYSLRRFFSRLATVETVYVIPAKRVGFVTFGSVEEAEQLLSAEASLRMGDHRLSLSRAHPKADTERPRSEPASPTRLVGSLGACASGSAPPLTPEQRRTALFCLRRAGIAVNGLADLLAATEIGAAAQHQLR